HPYGGTSDSFDVGCGDGFFILYSSASCVDMDVQMRHIQIFLILMQAVIYVVTTGITFYFGWLMLSGAWGALTGAPDGFERLGRAVLYFFAYIFVGGFLLIVIQALTDYVSDKVSETEGD